MPMKVAAKPEPGIEMNGELKPVAIAFASIVLPVPGARRGAAPRSRLPPARSKWSPDCQIRHDPANLLLRLGLAAHVVELHAPFRVARLERLDLREVHREQRAEHDREVREEEEEDEGDLDPERLETRRSPTIPSHM